MIAVAAGVLSRSHWQMIYSVDLESDAAARYEFGKSR